MKVAELFAELGIKPDKASFKAAERRLEDFNRRVAFIQRRAQARQREGRMGDRAFRRQARLNARGRRGGGGVGGLGLAGLGLSSGLLVGGGLAAGVGAAAKSALSLDEALTRIDVASDGAIGSVSEFKENVLDVSRATGLAAEEVIAGSARFVALTGDGKNAAAAMDTFARVARASGTPVDDIARAAAALRTNLNIDPSQFEEAFSVMIRGGKAGAVELNDFAGILATLAPEAAKFRGGGGLEGLRSLSAQLQVVQRGAGSAGEAATQLSSLFGALMSKQFRKKSGIDVFDYSKDEQGRTVKTLKSMSEILDMIAGSKLARDPELLREALGRKEAQRAVSTLLKHRDSIGEIERATIGAKDVTEDFDKTMQSTSARAKKAWNEMKIAATEAGEPVAELATGALSRFAQGVEGARGVFSGEYKELEQFRKRGQAEARELGRSGVSQILTGREGVEADILRRQLFGSGSTDPLGSAADPTLLDIVGRAAIAAQPTRMGEGRGVLIEAPATISTTITINGNADPQDVERQATSVIRREFDRWARAIASEFGDEEAPD